MWPISTQPARRTLFLSVGLLLCLAQICSAAPAQHTLNNAAVLKSDASRYLRSLLRPRIIRVDYETNLVNHGHTLSHLSQLTFDPLGSLQTVRDEAGKEVVTPSGERKMVAMDAEGDLFILTLREKLPRAWRVAVWLLPVGLFFLSYVVSVFICFLWSCLLENVFRREPLDIVIMEKGLPQQVRQRAHDLDEEEYM